MTPVRWQLCNYSKTFNLCLFPTPHSSVPRPSRGAPRNADSSEKAPTWGIRVTLRFFLQWQNQDEHHLHPKDFITAPLPFSQAWCFPGHPCPGSILAGVSENCHLMAFSSFQILHSSCTSSSHSCFNWRHSSPTISQLWAGQNTQYPRARPLGTLGCLRLEKLHPSLEVVSGSKSPVAKRQWWQNLNLEVNQALIHYS